VPSLHDALHSRSRNLLEISETEEYESEEEEIFKEDDDYEDIYFEDDTYDRPFFVFFMNKCEQIEISKCTFSTNTGFKNIIFLKESSAALIEGSFFLDNGLVLDSSSVIASDRTPLKISNSEFYKNKGNCCSSLILKNIDNECMITSSTFHNNTVSTFGGAACTFNSNLTAVDSSFMYNSA